MDVFNCVEFVQNVIISELERMKGGGKAAELVSEFIETFGDYDTYSLVFTDAYGEINDNIAEDISEELRYFLRRCAFMSARLLVEEYGITETLGFLLNKSIKSAISAIGPFFTDEDHDNDRLMNDVQIGLPALIVALMNEVLSSTPEELYNEDSAKDTHTA